MDAEKKFANATRRMELILEEVRLLSQDAECLVAEMDAIHSDNFGDMAIVTDSKRRLAEKRAHEWRGIAAAFRDATERVATTAEIQMTRVRDRERGLSYLSGE